jgi:hypothetical protein
MGMLYGQDNISGTIKIKGIDDIARERSPELFLPQDEFETNAEYNQRVARKETLLKDIRVQLLAETKARKKEKARLVAEQAEEEERLLQIKIAESLAPAEFTPSALGKYDAENGAFPLTVGGQTYTVKIPRSEARDFKENYRTAKVEGYQQLAHKKEVHIVIEDDVYVVPYGDKMEKIYVGDTFKIVRDDGHWYKIEYQDGVGFVSKKSGTAIASLIGGYDYFNMVVIHPITGSRFPFGPTKDIAAAPVIASKKSVVPPDLSMRVAFVEPNGNGFLDAEEKGKVKVSITNSGQGSAMGVFVKLNAETSNRDISAGTSKIIGEIPAGQTKTTEFEINASKSVSRMENRFTVSATESYGFPPDPALISFETFPFIPPKLELVDFGVSTPNEGNEIRPQTTTEVQARVQNRGQGPAEDVQFSINLPKGVYFTPDSRQDYSFSSLKPGEFKDLEFSFNTAKTVDKTIDVSIGFTEESTTGKFPLDLEVAKPQQTIQQLVVSGQEMGTVEFADVATVSVDIEKDIPTSGRKGEFDLAIVFGIESYKNVPGVSFAKRDAEWMKKYFESVLGIPKNRIYYKTDSDVGQAEFNKVFGEKGWIEKRIKKGKSNVFVYYAGHGAPDKKTAYLIPYDGDPNYASQTGYEMDKLYEQLGSFEAKSTTVFLDACFSGANRESEMLLADARPVFMEVDESATRNVTVFSASSGSEISSAWPEKKHGLFSYYLMKGMRGDADVNGDKKITVGELGNYVKENVSDMAGMLDREQTPGLQTLDRNKVLVNY